MTDYRSLDLSWHCNFGANFTRPGSFQPLLGKQVFHRLPFQIGKAKPDARRSTAGCMLRACRIDPPYRVGRRYPQRQPPGSTVACRSGNGGLLRSANAIQRSERMFVIDWMGTGKG